MHFFELLLLALALSMDTFAVAGCLGLTMKELRIKKALIVGLYFGFFQAIMPLIGYLVALQFAEYITQFSHWVVFGLLSFIGVKMILGSLKKNECLDRTCTDTPCTDRKCPGGKQEATLNPKTMLPLAFATSIDALAVGVSFALVTVSIVPAISTIGIVTLVISVIGVKIGSVFGSKFKSKAELAGGIILILIGVRALAEFFIV